MKDIDTHIIKLIISYVSNDIGEQEFNKLSEWIDQDSNNKQLFSQYLLLYKKTRQIGLMHTINKDEAWQNITAKLQTPLEDNIKKKKVIPMYRTWRKYAGVAVFVGLMVTVYLFKESFNSTAEVDTVPEIVNTKTIEPGTNKATLTLGDGSQIVLEKDIPFQTTNANSDGNQIIYKGSKGNAKNLVYNYLTIARGEQFHIVLSDGTKVWLNSESQLKYPVNFIKGETRQVELLYGEAYFDVSPSTAHYGAKFKVKNNVQEVEVLGTEFNIKAYKDETNIYTTLVEGKVSITAETKNKILKPSQQLNLNLINKTLQVSTVNVHYEISWKDGVFSFRRKPLEEIVKVLSRWYDVDFVFDNEEIKKAGFNGNLSKEQKLEDILETIKSFGKINEYEINHKTVILK